MRGGELSRCFSTMIPKNIALEIETLKSCTPAFPFEWEISFLQSKSSLLSQLLCRNAAAVSCLFPYTECFKGATGDNLNTHDKTKPTSRSRYENSRIPRI